jgi:hypothetical protein
LGVPQVLSNYHNKSTEGMRWESFCVVILNSDMSV